MKRWILAALITGAASSQALAWGLGDIGGQILRKGAETTVTNAVNGGTKAPAATGTPSEAAPATTGGVVTEAASDAASQATTNALAKSGVPGAGVAGNVAGGLVKGLGGMFKKKPAAEPVPAGATDNAAQP